MANHIKRVCIALICLLIIYLILVPISDVVLQNYLDEFQKIKSQPISMDMVKQIFTSVLENKICSKFKKPVPPSNEFNIEKVVYCIMLCIVCVFLGYIGGIRKNKKNIYRIGQNIQNQNELLSFYGSDDDQPSTCSLCLSVFKPRIVLLPCKHICICSNCWIRFYEESQHNCPICRENIVEVMDVFST